MKNIAETGQLGEQLVTGYLRTNGFLILERNWRVGRYEIDIIALKNECIRFIEVKTRSAGNWGSAEDAITPQKLNSLRRAATAYLSRTRSHCEFQFDLAAVDIHPDGSSEIRYTESIL